MKYDKNMKMPSIERLYDYYPFDNDVVSAVSDARDAQERFQSFDELATHYGMADGPVIAPANDGHQTYEALILDPARSITAPTEDYDNTHARILHLPHAMPIDSGMTMRAFRLFEAEPSVPLIVTGNSSAPLQPHARHGKLGIRAASSMLFTHDLTPTVDPLLKLLDKTRVLSLDHLGYSYGADKAATASAHAAYRYGITTRRGVFVESAANFDYGDGIKGLLRLGLNFTQAGAALDQYIEASASPRPEQTRASNEAKVSLPQYLLGLGRLSNIATANALAHNGFESRVRRALYLQPDMSAVSVWGTKSELVRHNNMQATVDRLEDDFGPARIGSMIMQGMHHTGGDDIDLHAAIMLQGLRTH